MTKLKNIEKRKEEILTFQMNKMEKLKLKK